MADGLLHLPKQPLLPFRIAATVAVALLHFGTVVKVIVVVVCIVAAMLVIPGS